MCVSVQRSVTVARGFLPLFSALRKEGLICLQIMGSGQNSVQWTLGTEREEAKTTFHSCLGLHVPALKEWLEGAPRAVRVAGSEHWCRCWRDGPYGLPLLRLAVPHASKCVHGHVSAVSPALSSWWFKSAALLFSCTQHPSLVSSTFSKIYFYLFTSI